MKIRISKPNTKSRKLGTFNQKPFQTKNRINSFKIIYNLTHYCMKKIFLTSAILLIINILNFSYAQNVSIGPALGANLATMAGNGFSNTELKAGFAGGLFINYSIADDFGLMGSLLYSQQGTKIANVDNPFKFDYIQVPILASYFLGEKGSKFRPKILLGPQIGFLLKAESPNGTDLKANSESTDISGVLGLGFNYNLSKGIWLNMDARLGWGFTDINKATPEAYNRYGAVMVGLSFPLGNYDPNK
jgi:outer membrane protein W